MDDSPDQSSPLSATGVVGLDNILGGGLTPSRLYLIEGNPGSGKTTLALQYLLEGVRRKEPCLYVTLSETKAELTAVAKSHGWSLEGIEIVELTASEAELEPDNQHTMFQPADVELGQTTKAVLAEVERVKPRRVVIDSLSELRLLAQSSLRYRRQILAFKQFFTGRECTVLLLDDNTSSAGDLQLHSIAHGVISLEHLSPQYGSERRRLRVVKLRGQRFRGGLHDFNIATGGLDVFPRLVASEHVEGRERAMLTGDVPELDRLLGGGIDFGTSTLLVGPAGCGKSSVAINYARAAAARGDRAALFAFDERSETLLHRAAGLGMDLRPQLKNKTLTLQQVDPAELSPGEFAATVRKAVDGADGHAPAKVVVIDSLNGYLHAMPEEDFLTVQMHELLTYLGHKGVVTFLVLAQHGMIGSMQAPVDTTYLADTVVLFRYFEAHGEVRQAISVVKKRSGKHERTIRELKLDNGIRVGEPLKEFRGVLTGTPTFDGEGDTLMGPANA
ncbi:circadian clock protein : KaiC family protein OS=Asticcacaulis biprosthecum C19 GN=ABI_22470 PE=4 SV=1: KaiC: KaiC [Gemmata massiliana]|uniref:non-specific serine/threonine protein kinase n=1 Tax=Gemmata massiliana TaxID=1210884 RepID=A0A6P2D1X4_9BACT|nr:ATPase domain-containing protein [Gemmata massiliana]VTR95119.1 circadian clock protein : KaiC family protein OS=Asticcacaulis biprosthecum C19 GN=ABI_22470 PE=4 SV=1: KaiC: KaiC [Gemmata massiliana]